MDNDVWQLVLQLRQIVELICAPKITAGQIAYMKVLIEEYLQSRKESFPDQPLKPKHHYLSHYPDLTIRFGPLIHLWTLRFESKHAYFKQCARKLHNFKSICSTLAERHQLLQAYLSAGYILPPCVAIKEAQNFLYRTTVIRYKNQLPLLAFSQPALLRHMKSLLKAHSIKRTCVLSWRKMMKDLSLAGLS